MTEYPDWLFRSLSPVEEGIFRTWARDHHRPGESVSPAWHPAVRDECARIDRGEDPMTQTREYPKPTVPEPDEDTLIAWLSDEEEPEATDGCAVEPDGICPDGHPSWLRVLGLI